MRIVLDTNVFVSGIFWAGTPYTVLKAWAEGRFKLAVTENIVSEYEATAVKLQRKYKHINFWPFMRLLEQGADFFEDIKLKASYCRDPGDDVFIACAMAAKAKYIVSGDKDLLHCENVPAPIEVLTAKSFLNHI